MRNVKKIFLASSDAKTVAHSPVVLKKCHHLSLLCPVRVSLNAIASLIDPDSIFWVRMDLRYGRRSFRLVALYPSVDSVVMAKQYARTLGCDQTQPFEQIVGLVSGAGVAQYTV